MYFWLSLLSLSNISLHRCSSLASLPTRVCLLARLIVLVLETHARMLERARECSYLWAQTCIKSGPYVTWTEVIYLMCMHKPEGNIVVQYCHIPSYIYYVKALPRVCKENTVQGVCWEINTARGEAECCILHTHEHRQCFRWYIVLWVAIEPVS